MALPLVAAPRLIMAAPVEPRRLRFYHTHTGEKLDVVYSDDGAYLPDALGQLDYLLRDFRSGEVVRMADRSSKAPFLPPLGNRVPRAREALLGARRRAPSCSKPPCSRPSGLKSIR